MRRIIHAVRQNAALNGSLINGGIYLSGISGDDNQIVVLEVGEFKVPLSPFETALKGELLNFRDCIRRNNAQPQARLEQDVYLVERNSTRADHQSAATVEFEKDR